MHPGWCCSAKGCRATVTGKARQPMIERASGGAPDLLRAGVRGVDESKTGIAPIAHPAWLVFDDDVSVCGDAEHHPADWRSSSFDSVDPCAGRARDIGFEHCVLFSIAQIEAGRREAAVAARRCGRAERMADVEYCLLCFCGDGRSAWGR